MYLPHISFGQASTRQLICNICVKGRKVGELVDGDLVVHSKSTHFPKPWLSMIECGHHMDGWPSHARLSAQVSPGSKSVQTLYLQKSFGWDYKPRSCVYMYSKRLHIHAKDPVVHVRVWWIMETLKHPACTVGWVARLLLQLAFPVESNLVF